MTTANAPKRCGAVVRTVSPATRKCLAGGGSRELRDSKRNGSPNLAARSRTLHQRSHAGEVCVAAPDARTRISGRRKQQVHEIETRSAGGV